MALLLKTCVGCEGWTPSYRRRYYLLMSVIVVLSPNLLTSEHDEYDECDTRQRMLLLLERDAGEERENVLSVCMCAVFPLSGLSAVSRRLRRKRANATPHERDDLTSDAHREHSGSNRT